MTRARVIGAGLSGLVASWHLADRGLEVEVFERASRPGGLIQTHYSPHGLVETAANAFVWDDVVAGWFRRLDLTPVFPTPASKRRYIFRDGRARRWPLTTIESLGMAARLARAGITRTTTARAAETIAGWGDRVLGPPARQWLLEPAMQGIYGSPADRLSARAIFDGRKRGPRMLAAPADGMGQFTTRLHERLTDRGVRFVFNTVVDRLEPGLATVIAASSADAGQLLQGHAPAVAASVSAIRQAPLTTVTMFFEPRPQDVHGFGVLFPSACDIQALGVLFNADIFGGRGAARSETWIVGDRESGMTEWSDQRLREVLAADRLTMTGRSDAPLASHITRWPQAIPVYDEAVRKLTGELASLPPWLALAGNYLGKIGVAALLDQAAAAANRVGLTAGGSAS